MKIENKLREQSKMFDDVSDYTILSYTGGNYIYMKIPEILSEIDNRYYNVINLTENSFDHMDRYETITVYDNVKLVIE